MDEKVEFSKLIQILSEIGLNQKDAKVYLELLKYGPEGRTVNDLDHTLGDKIPRTTIYSILNKLKDIGCVKEEGKAVGGGRKATNYVPIKFSQYIDIILSRKQEEIEHLEGIRGEHTDYFDFIYQSGIKYTIEDVVEEFRPYISPLLEKGWEISSFDMNVWDEYFEYKVYDCMLKIPYAKFLKDKNSIHLFEFKYEIENETNSLKAIIDSLKRKTEEIIGYESDLSEYQLVDTKFEVLGRNTPGLILKAKIKDLKSSRFFSDFHDAQKIIEKMKDSDELIVWRSVIMPYKNKIFFVWAESMELINEMFDAINNIEKIK